MRYIFACATKFNREISSWNILNKDTYGMFDGAKLFDTKNNSPQGYNR